MTVLTTVRRAARHRVMSKDDLRAELRRRDHEADATRDYFQRLTTDRDQVYAAYETEKTARAAAEDELIRVAGERDTAQATAQRLAEEVERQAIEIRFLRQQLLGRDTTDLRDQATVPVRTVQDDFPDDYLDRTRQTWRPPVMPLHQAPFAATSPTTAPTDLPGNEPTITLHIGHTAA